MSRDTTPTTIYCPACAHPVASEGATVWVLTLSSLIWQWGGQVEFRCGACGEKWLHRIGGAAR